MSAESNNGSNHVSGTLRTSRARPSPGSSDKRVVTMPRGVPDSSRLPSKGLWRPLTIWVTMPKGGGGERSPNDQRSDSKNPTSQEYKDAMASRADQLNPQHPAYASSRGGNTSGENDDDFEYSSTSETDTWHYASSPAEIHTELKDFWLLIKLPCHMGSIHSFVFEIQRDGENRSDFGKPLAEEKRQCEWCHCAYKAKARIEEGFVCVSVSESIPGRDGDVGFSYLITGLPMNPDRFLI